MSSPFPIRPGIGARLKEERKALSLSQEALGQKIGVAKLTVFSYEKELSPLDVRMLAKLSAAGVDVYYLLTGERLIAGMGGAVGALEQLLKEVPELSKQIFLAARSRDESGMAGFLEGLFVGRSTVRSVSPTKAQALEKEPRVRRSRKTR